MNQKLLKLVQIHWEDHNTQSNSWKSRDEIAKLSTPVEVVSMGAIIHEDDKVVSLIHTYSHEGAAMHGVTILKSCITKRKKLFYK